ncbi:MAG: DUF4349 domain-containing protein [Nanoarchaeota archaeon]|nr:DUF4349 domain-containing protein [Nanoarchaeota archaeon]MBU1643578.1 DUF4349 domain-containing protein [Nanoarchaeota archaeon]MBU1977174.1 DUF4349 domain-containing protein [Nanoarchaeota archaeon]
MTLKNQWETIKENWLIALVVVSLVLVILFSGSRAPLYEMMGGFGSSSQMGIVANSMMAEKAMAPGMYPIYNEDFAPQVEERKITKSVSLGSEVKRGSFKEAETQLKSIVTSTDSYLLNENTWKSGQGKEAYFSGNYQIKVDTKKYDAIIEQLKQIGEVTFFSENAQDITAQFENLEIELAAEKERLKRYLQMYEEAKDIDDKINLNDRIFSQERTIKYLEDSLKSTGEKVEYSTISVSLTEKQSDYVNIAIVKFSELVRRLIDSFNSLLSLIFVVLPYALAALAVWLVYRKIKK